MKIKQHIYYARIHPPYMFDVCELVIRTIKEDYFVGIDKHDKHAYLFSPADIGKIVFLNRDECLELVQREQDRWEDCQ